MTPEGYQISRSVRLRSSASAYFNRTPASSGTRTKATISLWVKRGAISSRTPLVVVRQGATDYFILEFQSDDTLQAISVTSSTTNTQLVTTQVFRDPSAWYHIVFTYDSTVATPNSSSIYLSVNGVKVTALSTATYPSQNTNLYYNIGSVEHDIGKLGNLTTYADCYLTEINSTDGQASAASSFGETDAVTGVWKPKKYAGTYGTNGFYLNFSDNSNNTAATIGKDYSGNGNNWTPNNISVTSGVTYDSMLDVPTPYADGGNGRGNYCVLNPLTQRWSQPNSVYSEGNLKVSTSSANSAYSLGTIFQSTGKWYWEVTVVAAGTTAIGVGVGDLLIQNTTQTNSVQYLSNGNKNVGGSSTSYGATFTTNDTIGVALDKDGGTITFYKNNTSQGVITLPSNVELSAWLDINTPAVFATNFGQRPFAYTPPTGFKALNTQNLPDSTIKKGNQYFDATTYTGNGSTQSIVNSGGMQPDLVWYKSRGAARDHSLFDSVRGATNQISSNATYAESAVSGVTAFNSNGFSLGSSANGNNSSESYVGWQWKKGATQGFDIVTYTGNGAGTRSVAHSLGVAPKFIVIKDRSSGTAYWAVYHASIPTQYLTLNSTSAAAAGQWISADSSNFSFSSLSSWTNTNADNYVAYLFADVAGFSKFGSYTGNGSTDGPFAYLGFRPRFVMIKRTDSTGNWRIVDTSRDTSNVSQYALWANDSSAEGSGSSHYIDILSNGFKIRNTSLETNASGGTFVYAAFSENPFKNSLAR